MFPPWHALTLCCLPPPQLAEQAPQAPQGAQLAATVRGEGRERERGIFGFHGTKAMHWCKDGHICTCSLYVCTRVPSTYVHVFPLCMYTCSLYVCTRVPSMYVHLFPLCMYTCSLYVCTRVPSVYVHVFPLCMYTCSLYVCILVPSMYVYMFPLCMYTCASPSVHT